MSDNDTTLAEDKLTGVAAIAEFNGDSPRRTRHLISKKLIPTGREGDRVVASKRRLREHWEQITSGEDPAEPCREDQQ